MIKTIKRIALAVVVIAATVVPASAQISFGPKVGVAIDRLSFNKEALLSSDNRAGFTGGLMLEVMLPIANLGFDASVMYVHRTTDIVVGNSDAPHGGIAVTEAGRDYIEVPINLKWKIGLPIVGKVFTPYVFTGPSFAFLTSKKAINAALQNKTFDTAWNFGVGIQLFSKLQVGASYGLGLTKAMKAVGIGGQAANIDGKNKYWTVTAAWMF